MTERTDVLMSRASWRPPALRALGRLSAAIATRSSSSGVAQRSAWSEDFGVRVVGGPWTPVVLDLVGDGGNDGVAGGWPERISPELKRAMIASPSVALPAPAASTAPGSPRRSRPPARTPIRLRSLRSGQPRGSDVRGPARRAFSPVLPSARRADAVEVGSDGGSASHGHAAPTAGFVPIARTSVHSTGPIDGIDGIDGSRPTDRPAGAREPRREIVRTPPEPAGSAEPGPRETAIFPIPTLDVFADPPAASPETNGSGGIEIRFVPPPRDVEPAPAEASDHWERPAVSPGPQQIPGGPDRIDIDAVVEKVSAALARRELIERERRGGHRWL
jgi:hypothetical protein